MNNLTLQRYLKFLNPIRCYNNFAWRYLCNKSDQPYVFVIGAPRSGTTLMFSIINSHPAFSGVDDETYFFVLRDIFNENFKGFYHANGLSKQEFIRIRKESKDLINFYDNLGKFILRRDSAVRFIEKTPEHVVYLNFLLKNFPQAKFINMVRDGRDCYISHKKLESHLHRSVKSFANYWRYRVLIGHKFSEHPHILNVRYESLSQKPLETITKVMDFIGEEFLPLQMDPNYYSKTNLKKYKGHDSLKKPINPDSIGRWREKMSREEVAIFHNVAGKTLQKLGYEVVN